MTLCLHWSPDSANIVIRMALESFALPYEETRLFRGEGDHKSAPHLALNPQGLIPVLEDGDLVLFETGAILFHLCEKMGRCGPDGPPVDDPLTRGALLKWLFYISNTPHAEMRAMNYAFRYVEGEAAIPALCTALARRRAAHLSLIEDQLPQTGGLLGPLTVLETYLASLIRWFQLYSQPEFELAGVEPWPKLHAILSELEARPAIRRAFRAEGITGEHPLTAPERPQLPPRPELAARG